jgi:hypothetical protein
MNRNGMAQLIGLGLLLLSSGVCNRAIAHDLDDDCDPLDAKLMPGPSSNVSGHAEVCIGPAGVSVRIRASNLKAGHAYTLWFGYIEHPEMCQTRNACDGPDYVGDDPLGVVGRLDSAVRYHHRRHITLSGSVRGFHPAHKSLIMLFVFGHGQARYDDTRFLARQLLTPQDPGLGAPGLGTFGDGAVGVPKAVAFLQIE